eukprot:518769-Prymnesium_polylepis.2
MATAATSSSISIADFRSAQIRRGSTLIFAGSQPGHAANPYQLVQLYPGARCRGTGGAPTPADARGSGG